MTDRVVARDRGRKPGTPVRQDLAMPGDDASWHELQSDQRTGKQTGSLLVPNGAGWVEHDTLGVAEEVARRWPNMRVAKCQQRCTDCAALGHYPYVVMELTRSGKSVPVLGFLRLDRTVIDTIWSISHAAGDQQKLADAHNQKVRAELDRKSAEAQQASLEIVGAALKSRKFDWRGPGGVKVGRGMAPSEARRALTQR